MNVFKETNRQINRQTDRQADRFIDRQTKRQIDRLVVIIYVSCHKKESCWDALLTSLQV